MLNIIYYIDNLCDENQRDDDEEYEKNKELVAQRNIEII